MKRISIPDGWYGDALASGEYISVIQNVGVNFNGSFIPIQSAGNNCLFARINPIDTKVFIGKSNSTGNVLRYLPQLGWNQTSQPTYGNSPLIYKFDGMLIVQETAPGVGAQGYSYIDWDTKFPVSQDKAYGNGLAQRVYIGDGIYVGQGLNGGTRVNDNGVIRILDENAPMFLRYHRIGNDVAFYYWDQNGEPAQCIWTNIAELKALPVEVVNQFGLISPYSPIGYLISDTTKFVFGQNNKPRTKDHLIEQVEISPNVFAYVKFGDKNAYEIWAKDDYGVRHLEDASNSASNITKRFERTEWIPKSLKVGRSNGIFIPEHDEVWMNRVDCKVVNRVPSVREVYLLHHWKQFNVGTKVTEVIAVVYDPTNGVHTTGRYIEVNLFALDIGWIEWQSHKSWVVFSSGSPVFNDASLAEKKSFYLDSDIKTIPNITGCAVKPIPIPEPGNLVKPEVTVLNWSPEVKNGWEFKAIDRMNPGFGFRLFAEKGSFYATITNPVGDGNTGASRPFKVCNTSAPPVEPPPNPIPPGVISKIRVEGLVFQDEQNNIFPYRGFTSFLLYKRFLDGEDIRPYVKLWSALGYNVARVFSQVDWTGDPGPGFFASSYPNYNAQLNNFFALLSQEGMYCEFTIHTFDYNLNEMASHVVRCVQIAQNHKNVFIELANEPPVNGIDIQGLVNRLDTSSWNMPWSTGLYDVPSRPAGKYLTVHLDRGDEWPRKFRQLLEYRDGGGPDTENDPAMNMPVVHDEPIGGATYNQPGKRSNVTSDFYSHGAGCQLHGAGGTYHHQSGLNSIMPIGLELDCAKAFITGLRLVLPIYQLGNYTRVGLQGCPFTEDASLRTYGMIMGNLACMVRVRPTTPYIVDFGWKVTSEDSQKIVITLVRV